MYCKLNTYDGCGLVHKSPNMYFNVGERMKFMKKLRALLCSSSKKDEILSFMKQIEQKSRLKYPNARIESSWELHDGKPVLIQKFVYDKVK
jgi:hypothetical protein